MDIQTIQNDIARLYDELATVKDMSFKQACKAYNVDYKREAIALIKDEINKIESDLEDIAYDYTDEELEDERQQICHVQGISRYC